MVLVHLDILMVLVHLDILAVRVHTNVTRHRESVDVVLEGLGDELERRHRMDERDTAGDGVGARLYLQQLVLSGHGGPSGGTCAGLFWCRQGS